MTYTLRTLASLKKLPLLLILNSQISNHIIGNQKNSNRMSNFKFRIVKFQIFKFQNCLRRFHAYFKPIVKTLQKLSCTQLWRAQTFTYVIIGYCIGLRQNFIWWELVLTVIFTKKCKNCFVFNWFVWYKYDIYVKEQSKFCCIGIPILSKL